MHLSIYVLRTKTNQPVDKAGVCVGWWEKGNIEVQTYLYKPSLSF